MASTLLLLLLLLPWLLDIGLHNAPSRSVAPGHLQIRLLLGAAGQHVEPGLHTREETGVSGSQEGEQRVRDGPSALKTLRASLTLVADSYHGPAREILPIEYLPLGHCTCIRTAPSSPWRERIESAQRQQQGEDTGQEEEEQLDLETIVTEEPGLAPSYLLQTVYYLRHSSSACSLLPAEGAELRTRQQGRGSRPAAFTFHIHQFSSCDSTCRQLHPQPDQTDSRGEPLGHTTDPLLAFCQLYNRFRWEICTRSLHEAVHGIGRKISSSLSSTSVSASLFNSHLAVHSSTIVILKVQWVHGTHVTIISGGDGSKHRVYASLSIFDDDQRFCLHHQLSPQSCEVLKQHMESARYRVKTLEALEAEPRRGQEKRVLKPSQFGRRETYTGGTSSIGWQQYENLCVSTDETHSPELIFVLDGVTARRVDRRLLFTQFDEALIDQQLSVRDQVGASYPKPSPFLLNALNDLASRSIERSPIKDFSFGPRGSFFPSRLVPEDFIADKIVHRVTGHTLLGRMSASRPTDILAWAEKLMVVYAMRLTERLRNSSSSQLETGSFFFEALGAEDSLFDRMLLLRHHSPPSENQKHITDWATGLAEVLVGPQVGQKSVNSSLQTGVTCFDHVTVLGTSAYLHPSPEAALAFTNYVSRLFGAAQDYDTIVLISRDTMSNRRWKNQIDVKQAIERVYGTQWRVELVELGRLPFHKMVPLLSQTAILIGLFGADLTNLIFLPPGAVVIELSGHQFPSKLYEGIATASAHPYFQYLGNEEEVSYHNTTDFSGRETQQQSVYDCYSNGPCLSRKDDYDMEVDIRRFMQFLEWPVRSALPPAAHARH